MRTTIRLDDELFEELKERARKENVSLTRFINRALAAGLAAGAVSSRKPARYRQRTHAMGEPTVSLDKALAVSALLEDEEIVRKLALRK
ncbi:MAG: ribbon-helix-helix protein, CopG family [Rudaea sp.]